jgi:putative ABC transport system substrate-binding protein
MTRKVKIRIFAAEIAKLAQSIVCPRSTQVDNMFRPGGLMSYAPDFVENWRPVAIYIEKVLKGAQPADLPSSSR